MKNPCKPVNEMKETFPHFCSSYIAYFLFSSFRVYHRMPTCCPGHDPESSFIAKLLHSCSKILKEETFEIKIVHFGQKGHGHLVVHITLSRVEKIPPAKVFEYNPHIEFQCEVINSERNPMDGCMCPNVDHVRHGVCTTCYFLCHSTPVFQIDQQFQNQEGVWSHWKQTSQTFFELLRLLDPSRRSSSMS